MRRAFSLAGAAVVLLAFPPSAATRAGADPAKGSSGAHPAPPSSAQLPDVVGIRPGIGIQQAVDLLRAHDRGASLFVSDMPLAGLGQEPVTPKPVPYAIALARDPYNSSELIAAYLTLPPSKSTVWRVARRLKFPEGKQPTVDNTIASLRQKYGQEADRRPGRLPILTWYFDAQGRRLTSLGGMPASSCGGMVGPTDALANVVPDMHSAQPLLVQPLDDREAVKPCRSAVAVNARAEVSPDGRLVTQLDVIVADLPLEARAHVATLELIARVQAQRQKREDERANQVQGPEL